MKLNQSNFTKYGDNLTKYLKNFVKHFTKYEEKYVFNISLSFWRLWVGLAGLALVLGLLFFLWGIIPAFKSSVNKGTYPPVVTISLQELQQEVLPAKKSAAAKTEKSTQTSGSVATSSVQQQSLPAPGEVEYQSMLDSLKALIPPKKYAWKSRGHWEYPYGKDYWEYYRTSRYRKWKVDRLGIKDRLKYAYARAKADDYLTKKELLNGYISVVSQFPEEKRPAVLEAVCTYTRDSLLQSLSNVQLLSESIPNFSTESTDYLKKLATFGKKNPNDGGAFIGYTNGILNRFDAGVRFKALQAMMQRYYKHFNNRIDLQIKITDEFLTFAADFEPEYQVRALEKYYELYLNNHARRMAAIERIEDDYSRELSYAASQHYQAKANKAEWRMWGLYAIGGGVVVIAFLALVLALLSMQKNLERIYESLQAQ